MQTYTVEEDRAVFLHQFALWLTEELERIFEIDFTVEFRIEFVVEDGFLTPPFFIFSATNEGSPDFADILNDLMVEIGEMAEATVDAPQNLSPLQALPGQDTASSVRETAKQMMLDADLPVRASEDLLRTRVERLWFPVIQGRRNEMHDLLRAEIQRQAPGAREEQIITRIEQLHLPSINKCIEEEMFAFIELVRPDGLLDDNIATTQAHGVWEQCAVLILDDVPTVVRNAIQRERA